MATSTTVELLNIIIETKNDCLGEVKNVNNLIDILENIAKSVKTNAVKFQLY